MSRYTQVFHFIVLFILLFLTSSFATLAQRTTTKQTVRGIIKDQASNAIITNAAVELLNYSPRIAVQTNEKGYFVLEGIPTGRQRFRIIAEGYYELIQPALIVGGKETILSITLVEEISEAPFVTVEAKRKKNNNDIRRFQSSNLEPIDELNVVSTHKFNVKEVNEYIGGANDPARTVTNVPGLFNIDDTQNYIVSRGNSPYGIRWQIEDIPIDNPHHFSRLSNTGAVFPLLNTNLLDNSDFVNGAMPAHYGDAYAGVFDINLRRGNNQNFEFLGQVSLYGIEAVAEGPFKKGGASFVASYRYGVLSFLNLIGLDVGTNAVPEYQDINFKINIPTKKMGEFSIFGIGGISNVDILYNRRNTNDVFVESNIDVYSQYNIGILGITHQKNINQKTHTKTTLAYSTRIHTANRDTITNDTARLYNQVYESMHKISINSIIQSKINAKALFRAGVHGNISFWDVNNRFTQSDTPVDYFNGFILTGSGFAEFRYKFSYKFEAVLGLHGRTWSLNKESWALEPRLSLNWFVHQRHRISFGYGWHSKTQPLPILFKVQPTINNSVEQMHPNLGATRSHHTILSYDLYLAKYWSLKLSGYAQLNTDIPITPTPSSFSLINYGSAQTFPNRVDLVAEGIAVNYGLELAVNKFFSRGYYGKLGATYFRSQYQGSDQEWRSTPFDVLYVAQLIGGKEFKIGREKRNVFYFDLRYSSRGGQPYTPILLNASKQAKSEILDEKNAFSQRLGNYNRVDIRLGLRLNHRYKNISHHFYIEILNATNTSNDLAMRYSPQREVIITTKQFGLIPFIFYQIRF